MDQLEMRYTIFRAIKLSTFNKPDPDAPPGSWSCWICDHGVYGEQMQTQFCLTCGEYKWLSYQTIDHNYVPSKSEPDICQCRPITYRL